MTSQHVAAMGRRAAALVVHHQASNTDGMTAVLDEVTTGEDTTYLLLALLSLFEHLLTECPPTTVARTRAAIVKLAAIEHGGQT